MIAATHTGVWVAFIALMLVAWRLSEWITWRGKYGLGNDLDPEAGGCGPTYCPVGLLDQTPAVAEVDAMSRTADELYNGEAPSILDSDTSVAAGKSIDREREALRWKCLRLIQEAGDHGRTCDEAEEITGARHQTISARVRELAQMGFIVDTGRRRATRSGRDARIYVLGSPRQSLF
jgi:hypothetical protein